MDVICGNVVKDKATNKKRVIRKPETLDEAQYELVCENPLASNRERVSPFRESSLS